MEGVVRGPLRECHESKLLTEEDAQLLEEKLNEGARSRPIYVILIPFLAFLTSLYTLSGYCDSNGLPSVAFGLKVVFNLSIVFSLYVSHLLWLPYVVRFGTWQFHRVDYRFHKFVGDLRQKDTVLYGLKHMTGDQSKVHNRALRAKCIEQLRRLVSVAQEFGGTYNLDFPSISEFLTDELRELSSEGAEILDDHLQLSALNALWQFYYVLRSESLRNYALCHADLCQRALADGSWWSFLRFGRASLLEFIKFAWFSTRFDVALEAVKSQPKSQRKAIPQRLSEAQILQTQLEYALERLDASKLETLQDRMALADLLMNVVHQLKSIRKEPRAPRVIHRAQAPAPQAAAQEEAEEEREPEYQVFEADEDDTVDESSECEFDDPLAPPAIPIRDLQAELHCALASRREHDFEMQARALAKRRKKPVEEVREELRAEMAAAKRRPEIPPPPPSVPVRPRAPPAVRVDQSELAAALRQRFTNVQSVTTFGDSSSSSSEDEKEA
ncbi:hypothetical protein M3Y99_01865600 [Aphelenchoides fujianensis]|nr:hypothetical protein M3Y99_01865600 [Aphelenchoides fujianensis]